MSRAANSPESCALQCACAAGVACAMALIVTVPRPGRPRLPCSQSGLSCADPTGRGSCSSVAGACRLDFHQDTWAARVWRCLPGPSGTLFLLPPPVLFCFLFLWEEDVRFKSAEHRYQATAGFQPPSGGETGVENWGFRPGAVGLSLLPCLACSLPGERP